MPYLPYNSMSPLWSVCRVWIPGTDMPCQRRSVFPVITSRDIRLALNPRRQELLLNGIAGADHDEVAGSN